MVTWFATTTAMLPRTIMRILGISNKIGKKQWQFLL